MATIPYYEPAIFIPENTPAPSQREAPAGSGHTGTAVILRGDLVVLSGTPGTLARAATNANTGIWGLTECGELDVFKGGSGAPYDGSLFGAGQGSGIIPQNPGYVLGNPLSYGPASGLLLELSSTTATGYQTGGTYQVDIGSTGGILLDSTTNLYVFDPSQANKIFTIYSKPLGPNKGQSGDLAARFVVYVNTITALV